MWPPVMVTAGPEATTRGPASVPASTARPTRTASAPGEPRSRTRVTPASSWRRALTTAARVRSASVFGTSVARSGPPPATDVPKTEAGQQGRLGEVESRGPSGALGKAGRRAGVGDPAALDEQGGVGNGPGTGAVEQVRGPQ